jgi:hypothetical protein
MNIRSKEVEDNDEEQRGVNGKKIKRVFIFIQLYTFIDQQTTTSSTFLPKGWCLKADKSF